MLDRASEIEARTYRHANVVRALTTAFGAQSPAAAAAIKSKLKNFQTEGFGPPPKGRGQDIGSPVKGRGREIEYTFEDILDWALGLTLAQLGLPTKVILRNLKHGCYKTRLEKYCRGENNRVYIAYYLRLGVEFMPGDPIVWQVLYNNQFRAAFREHADENRIDYAISDFTQTKQRVHDELKAIIELDVRP